MWEKGSGIASVGEMKWYSFCGRTDVVYSFCGEKGSGIASVGERKCYSFCGRKEVV